MKPEPLDLIQLDPLMQYWISLLECTVSLDLLFITVPLVASFFEHAEDGWHHFLLFIMLLIITI